MKNQFFSLMTLALLILTSCQQQKQQEAVVVEESETPNYALFDKNVEVLRSFIKAHCDEDINAVGNFLSDTLKWSPPNYNGNQWLGKEDLVAAFKGYHDGYDDIKYTEGILIEDVNNGMWSGSAFPKAEATATPDVIRMYGTWTATHTESGKEIGVKWYALGWVNDDGKISQLSDYWDVHGLAAQIAEE